MTNWYRLEEKIKRAERQRDLKYKAYLDTLNVKDDWYSLCSRIVEEATPDSIPENLLKEFEELSSYEEEFV